MKAARIVYLTYCVFVSACAARQVPRTSTPTPATPATFVISPSAPGDSEICAPTFPLRTDSHQFDCITFDDLRLLLHNMRPVAWR